MCHNPSLRLATKARVCKVAGQKGTRESHNIHPKGVPLWELESRWTPESSEGDCMGQNSMALRVLYINGNILEHRYLKWGRIAHGCLKHKLWPKEGPGVKLVV
jgi:hypothetical protein